MQALLEMLQISDLLLHAIVRFSLRNFGECRAYTIELVDHDFEKHFRLHWFIVVTASRGTLRILASQVTLW